jgi:hypothetical protein
LAKCERLKASASTQAQSSRDLFAVDVQVKPDKISAPVVAFYANVVSRFDYKVNHLLFSADQHPVRYCVTLFAELWITNNEEAAFLYSVSL